MSETKTHDEHVQRLRELIKDIRVAMLTTISEDGSLHSRPLATQEPEANGDLWFFTGKHSLKVAELEEDNRVNVSYSKPDDNRFVTVSGRAELVDDPQKIKELWNPLYKAWFPDGLDDPELGLLKVNVEQAQYWDLPSGKMIMLFALAKSLFTGKTIENNDSGVVRL